MNEEERELLERTLRVSEENNKILKRLQRAGRFAVAFKIFYWLAIIGLAFGAYYFIEPYINELGGAYTKFNDTVKNLGR